MSSQINNGKRWWTDDEMRACEEHWDNVRAGFARSTSHEFECDPTNAIECHRHNARLHIEAAARRMRLVEALANEASVEATAEGPA